MAADMPTGRTRFDRLLLIGKSSVPLCVDALKGAVHEAKSGRDVSQYLAAWECLRLAAPNEPESQKDDAWIERVEAENKAETTRLESELKGYKNNLIKESIRVRIISQSRGLNCTAELALLTAFQMGHEDLGKHLENIGKLKEACDAYAKMRQDVSTSKHIADCAMHLALVSLYRKDYSMLLNNVGKMISARSGGEQDGKLQVYTRIASGIGLLEHCRYDEAAKAFLRIDFNIASSEYNHIASPNDIALYGGLLALATIDRKELQKEVLENPKFRTFLEHEPHIRKAISQFVNGRYSSCLAILEASRPDCLLDIYLQKHVPKIFSKIRSKCIVQYFIPFSCVTLESLDAAFAQPGSSLETELIGMIRQGALQARIDAKNKVRHSLPPAKLEYQTMY